MHHSIQIALADFISSLERRELIRRGRVDADTWDRSIRLDLLAVTGERLGYRFTEDEYQMGGREEFARWLETIRQDVESRHERWELSRPVVAPPPRRQFDEWFDMSMRVDHQRLLSELIAQRLDAEIWTAFAGATTADPKAETKSKDLFRAVAGQKAFDALEAGKGWPLTGSNGTKYTLHKRASYCIERPKDGAKLCAVVPGVPLWDHLLGIKLMVEHDEPKFLKTANVSGGAGTFDFATWDRHMHTTATSGWRI